MQVANNVVVRMDGMRIPDVNHPWGGPGLDRFSIWGDWRPTGDPPRVPEALGAALLGTLPIAIAAANGAALTLNCDYAVFEVPNGIPGSNAMFTTYGVRIVPNWSIRISVLRDGGHHLDYFRMVDKGFVLGVAGKVHAEIYRRPALELGAIAPPPAELTRLASAPA